MGRMTGHRGRLSLVARAGGIAKRILYCSWSGIVLSVKLLFKAGRALLPVLGHGLRILAVLTGITARWVVSHPKRSADAVIGVAMIAAFAALLGPPSPMSLKTSLDCLALNIYHEARGEPLLGKLAVGHVVLNRVAHPRFPGDVCTVITQGGEWPRGYCQFSWWCDGRSDRPGDSAAWRESQVLAREILIGTHQDPTEGALWYHATSVSPAWRMDFSEGPKIGNHVFYRPKGPPR